MMNAAISASQFKSRYSQTTAAKSAIVIIIFVNSPKKNVIGFKTPGLRALTRRRKANNPFGTTQHNPPSNAERKACIPPISPATAAAIKVTANWIKTRRNIFLFQLSQESVANNRQLRLEVLWRNRHSKKPRDYK